MAIFLPPSDLPPDPQYVFPPTSQLDLDAFWEEFSKFEASQVTTAEMTPEQKKEAIIAALSTSAEAYNRAAAMSPFSRQLIFSYKKREEKWREIDLKRFSLRASTPEDSRQLALWREALQFEASNPLGLPAEILRSRQETAFRRCLGCCYFAPEMWRDFATFESFYDIGASDAIWRKAIATMPQSSLLRLAHADVLENRGDLVAARAAYEEMAETAGNSTEWVAFQRFLRRTEGVSSSREAFRRARLALLRPEVFVAAGKKAREIQK